MIKYCLFLSLSISLAICISCKKEDDILNISGEFARREGTCTPFCLINISKDTLTLKGTDFKGSTKVTYIETYIRRAKEHNTYDITTLGAYIRVESMNNFTFTSTTRTCKFQQ
jgi:hypothetical protein